MEYILGILDTLDLLVERMQLHFTVLTELLVLLLQVLIQQDKRSERFDILAVLQQSLV